MGRIDSRRLVIDTDVARAAGGEDSVHPTGQRCRDFLLAVRDNDLRLVMSPDIWKEWSEHESGFARKWRRWMIGRKQFCHIEPTSDQALLDRLQSVDATDSQISAMIKDWPLVEAAVATDHTVASHESVVRELYTRACNQVGELRAIVWVNPDRPEEEPIAWLEQGAPPDDHRKLGWKE